LNHLKNKVMNNSRIKIIEMQLNVKLMQ